MRTIVPAQFGNNYGQLQSNDIYIYYERIFMETVNLMKNHCVASPARPFRINCGRDAQEIRQYH